MVTQLGLARSCPGGGGLGDGINDGVADLGFDSVSLLGQLGLIGFIGNVHVPKHKGRFAPVSE
jgi:hypothetical protein